MCHEQQRNLKRAWPNLHIVLTVRCRVNHGGINVLWNSSPSRYRFRITPIHLIRLFVKSEIAISQTTTAYFL